MPINTVEFDLSMVSPETGEYLTARAYTVPGVNNVDGTPRELSIGQLVMAICLQRATELEAAIIELMETMNKTSEQLEALTEIETEVLTWPTTHSGSSYRRLTNDTVSSGNSAYGGQTYEAVLLDAGVITDEQHFVRWQGSPDPDDIMFDDFMSQVESKMDEMNSFSQKTMIELQSLTSKRDQSYDMISNVLKSLNTVQVGIVNNY